MTRDEAKKILMLYRPGVADDSDPQMAAALELVQRDPELAAWFQQQCAVFDAIRSKLKSVPVPQGLRRQIVARHVAETRVPIPVNRWMMVAAVAALVLLTAIVWSKLGPNPQNTLEGYRDRMARMVQRGYFMQMMDTNQTSIRAYFAARGTPANYVLPQALGAVPGEGGVALTWNKHPVSLLCLNGATKPGESNNLYLFMADRSAVPGAPAPGQQPVFKPVVKLMTMTWTDGDHVFLLAAEGNEATLQKYLQ